METSPCARAIGLWVSQRSQRPLLASCGGNDDDDDLPRLGAATGTALSGTCTDLAGKLSTLAPYSKVARYKGAGSLDDAANFACQ